MSNSPDSGKKVSNKPKRANGRGSIYQITKSNGRKVWKAASAAVVEGAVIEIQIVVREKRDRAVAGIASAYSIM